MYEGFIFVICLLLLFFLMIWIQKFDIQHHIVDFSLTWNKKIFQEDHEYISYSNFKNILLGNCPFSYVVLHFPKSQHLFSLSLNLLLWFRDNLDCPSLFPVPCPRCHINSHTPTTLQPLISSSHHYHSYNRRMFQVHSNKMGLGSRLPHLRAHSSQWLLSPLTDDGVFLSRFGLLHPPQPTNHFSIFSNIIFPFFQFNIIYSFILYIYIYIWWEGRVFDWFISSYCTSALLGSQICLILETESCQCKFFFLGFLFGGSVSVIEIWVLVGVLDLWCGVGVLGCWMRFGMSPFLFL